MINNNSNVVVQSAPLWTKNFLFICFINLAIIMNIQLFLPTLPLYMHDLALTDRMVGVVMGLFTLAAVMLRPFSGMMVDRYGRKKVLLIGLMLVAVISFTYHITTSLLILVAVRVVHGSLYGVSSTATGTLASDLIPRQRMGEGMGYFGLTASLSMAVAPAIGLWLTHTYGFSGVFNLSTAIALLALLAGTTLTVSNQQVTTRKRERGSFYEKQAIPAATVIFLLTLVYGAVLFFVTLHATEQGVTNIGLFFTANAIAMLISRPFAGKLADRNGSDYLMMIGLSFMAASMVTLAYAHNFTVFILAGLMFGTGFGTCMPTLQALAVRNVQAHRRGAATGTYMTGFDLGLGTGAILWGLVASVVGYDGIYLSALLPLVTAGIVYFAHIVLPARAQ